MSSPNKSCDLDPLPTTLLKACLDTLLYQITNIINASLCSGLFPGDFKQSQVNPLLKKSTLPKENLNCYRFIFNLSFISKLLEAVVASRLTMSQVVCPMYYNQLTNSFILQRLLF